MINMKRWGKKNKEKSDYGWKGKRKNTGRKGWQGN
jgi:hypothetical protein